ncbi:BTAD domain-containing putative transcriptional regulator [Catellatospora sp. KI3]|uniref:AfsR/SARP family transcriptional regulator n=1 Tax=Catellatospora sp. KI3 TaxID=3041620 RepID=UPI002482D93F|nr:BTAD domain-containing putative transcriptional regulator [Catellatospora sp. KI3]MDI1462899.1 BTAD domain-containing putative transcriptional regulator [Catellatospora sp. KI3]
MDFRLLGPVEAEVDGRAVQLGGEKPRTLLATLLLERGRVVPAARLIDIVWGESPPDSARALVQTYVSTLRRQGLASVIQTEPAGYSAQVDPERLDLARFELLLAQARARSADGDRQAAIEALRTAEALWRGGALTGIDSEVLAGEATRLNELRLTATEERIAAELAQGQHGRLLPELTGLVGRHPANERLRGQLMLAYYRLGRQADALACFREGRDVLIEELGVEPGAELHRLHAAILRGDLPEVEAPRTAGAALPVPAQLPPVPADFTGRDEVLAALLPLAGLRVIAGAGGTGKTSLAARLAQDSRGSYPDGQLFADLRGMADLPAEPGEVLGGFLRALGVPVADVPGTSDERAQRFRALLSGRRVLVLLDDAATEQQVRPLLPGGPDCAVLVTSRDRLVGLAGVELTELDVLTVEEAVALLARIVGADRVAAEPAAARTIVDHCARLPLAIRVAGARLAARQRLPLSWLAERLGDESRRLHELSPGDQGVRASIALSYVGLSDPARTALRRLGYLGVTHFGPWVAGWLLDVADADGEELVEALVDAQLVEFAGIDELGQLRYRMHDLVRLYARERAAAEEAPEALAAAVARALMSWLSLVDQVHASSPPDDIRWPRPEVVTAPVSAELARAVRADPAAWFAAEQVSLTAAVERAAGLGLHELACAFAPEQYSVVFSGADRFEVRERVVGAALAAARRAGDGFREAVMLADLGGLRYMQDRYTESQQVYGQALGRFREVGDVRGQAAALAGLGGSCRESGRLAEAVHFLEQAATLLEGLGEDTGIGYTRRLIGSVRLEQGRYEQAWTNLEQSVAAYRRSGSRRGEALSLRTLGLYHRARDEHGPAERACAEAVEIFEQIGHPFLRTYAVRSLAKARLRQGRLGEALAPLEETLAASRIAQDRFGQASSLRTLGELHLAAGRLDLAEEFLVAARQLWSVLELPLWEARTDRDLALLRRAQGDEAAAAALVAGARKVFHEHGTREYDELTPPITGVEGGLKHS